MGTKKLFCNDSCKSNLDVLDIFINPNENPQIVDTTEKPYTPNTNPISEETNKTHSLASCLLLHLNIQGSNLDKFVDLKISFDALKMDPKIVCLSEHWFNEDTVLGNCFDSYKLAAFYSRNVKGRGGVCIFTKNYISFKQRLDISSMSIEDAFECTAIETFDTGLGNSKKSVFIVIYRTPNAQNLKTFFSCFEKLLQHLEGEKYKNSIYISGDFNIDFLINNEKSVRFRTLFFSFGYEAMFGEPTRITPTSATCIDNIISNVSLDDKMCKLIDFGVSDHLGLTVGTFSEPVSAEKNKKFLSKRVINENSIRLMSDCLAEESWDSCLSERTCNGSFNEFFRVLYGCFLYNCPIKTKDVSRKEQKNAWVTIGIKVSSRRKRELYRESRHNSNPAFLQYFRKYKQIFRKVVQSAKRLYNLNLIKQSDNVTKTTWGIVKKELGLDFKEQTCPEVKINGEVITDPVVVASSLNNYFLGVADDFHSRVSISDSISSAKKYLLNNSQSFEFNFVSESLVISCIKKLKNKKSAGWDEIPAHVIKSLAPFIIKPLTHCINISLQTGSFPEKLKYAQIKPVFKKGDSMVLSNYRPVALLPVLSKVFEEVALMQLVPFLESNNLLNSNQFGFRKGKGTSDAIIDLVSEVVKALDESQRAIGVFCDLSKAFDCVRHDVLLEKLKLYGIAGSTFSWFKSYLSNRFQQVAITDSYSRHFSPWCPAVHGVPQGSKVGPLLFLLYINDLSVSVSSKIIQFADDTTIIVKAPSVSLAASKASTDISSMETWFKHNGLHLNCSKTHILHFHNHQLISGNVTVGLESGDLIDSTDTTKFLGLNINENLKWSDHLNQINSSLAKALFGLRVIFRTTGLNAALTVYHSYFMSRACYGIIAWGSSSIINSIFILQKKAIRILADVGPRSSCRPLFIEMKLLTIHAVYIYQICTFVKNNYSDFLVENHEHQYNTRHRDFLQYPLHRTTLYEKSPWYMGRKIFNHLPLGIKCEEGMKSFKKKLKMFLLSVCPYSINDFLES